MLTGSSGSRLDLARQRGSSVPGSTDVSSRKTPAGSYDSSSVYLPPASLGHTRHYMPISEGRTITTTKEIDAFAAVGRDENAVLGVAWDVALTEHESALVDALAATLGYLGRPGSRISRSSTRKT